MIIQNGETSLDAALAFYFECLDRGEAVDEASLLARFPEHAAELQSFFADQRQLNAKVEQLIPKATAPNHLTVRCPNCHQPSEVAVDSTLTDLACSTCGGRFNLIDESAAGKAPPALKLGRFALIERLGVGAFGSVWKARDNELDRTVAVKIPRQGGMTAEEQEQFLREARAAAQLRHPNIVSVHEVGRENDSVYIVSDFVPGMTLGDWTADHRLTPREAAELCIQIADALQHAHEHGIVHRDLKPANIIIDPDGQPHLMDFGLALRDAGEVTVTVDGQLIGTPAYMSPEQAKGNAHDADRRSDVYSLGVILFQLITGELPFRGNAHMLVHQVIHDEPPSPRKLNGNIKKDLETIVLKAMEKNPARRYESAQQLASDLRSYLANKPIMARPASRGEKFIKWSRRHQTLVTVVGIALATLTAVVVASLLLINRARLKALDALDATSDLLYVADMKNAFDAWGKGWSDEVQPILRRHLPDARRKDRRGLEWYYLNRMTQRSEPNVLRGHAGSVNELALMPDRQHLASVGDDGTLRIWNLKDKTAKTIALGVDPLHSVAVSPDGRYVAAGSTSIHLVDLRQPSRSRTIFPIVDIRGTVLAYCMQTASGFLHAAAPASRCVALSSVLLAPAEYTVESLSFHPEGDRLVAGRRYDDVFLLSLNGEIIKRVPCAARVVSLEFVPQKNLLLMPNRRAWGGASPKILQLWRDDLSGVDREFGSARSGFEIARISPCSEFIAASEDYRSKTHIFHRKSGRVVAVTPQGRDYITSLAYSPDGRRIAIGCMNGIVECFQLEQVNDKELFIRDHPHAIAAHRGQVAHLKFIDAEMLATSGADGLIKLWDLSKTRTTTVATRDSTSRRVAVSPDGELVAHLGSNYFTLMDQNGAVIGRRRLKKYSNCVEWSHSGDRVSVCKEAPDSIQIYDRTGKPLLSIACNGVPRWAAFSPDGQLIAAVGEKFLQIYRADDGVELHREPLWDRGAICVAFSPDGRELVFGGYLKAIVLFDLASMRIAQKFPCASVADAVQFSPDGLSIASGHDDSEIRLWSRASGKLNRELSVHERSVRRLDYSADGRTLVSAAADGTVCMWSVDHEQSFGVAHQVGRIGTERDGADHFCDVSFSADGGRMAIVYVSQRDRTEMTLWDLTETGTP
jgi:WD40 repeat protein